MKKFSSSICRAQLIKFWKTVQHMSFDIMKNAGKRKSAIKVREIPLKTYHMDHLSMLETTNKNSKHILYLLDAFTILVYSSIGCISV